LVNRRPSTGESALTQSGIIGLALGAAMLLGFEAASAAPIAAVPPTVGLSAATVHATAGMERRAARRGERRVHRYERRSERYAHRAERRAIRRGAC
jgi:hypothetical protein